MSVNYTQLIAFRKKLHSQPEVSGNEKETAQHVLALLKTCNPDAIISDIGGHGILATWDSKKNGKEIIFRAELDALPIEEINEFAHKSTYAGVSHKCGHDGHATILCGLAQHLSANRPQTGKVRLLFQPAEENGEGAKAMLEDKKINGIQPDYIFALHNLPGYPLSEVVVKEKTFTAAVTSIIIHLKGKTSHAAEPEHGINPALAIAQIIEQSLALADNKPEKEDMKVITPVYIEMGEKAYGISAGEASVHLTIRCWNDENLLALQKNIEKLSNEIGKKFGLKTSFDYTQTFHANMNNLEAVAFVRKSSVNQNLRLTERPFPFKWGEDFGLFTAKYKGCMFGLGSGENSPALHNPDYDFPDELIKTGVTIFSGIINQLNTKN